MFDYIERFYNLKLKDARIRHVVAHRLRASTKIEFRVCLEHSGLFNVVTEQPVYASGAREASRTIGYPVMIKAAFGD